jgi:hypothetical protein
VFRSCGVVPLVERVLLLYWGYDRLLEGGVPPSVAFCLVLR